MEFKKKKPIDMTDHELLAELVEQGRQEAIVRNIGIIIRLAVLVVIIILGIIIVPKVIDAYNQVKQTAVQIESTVGDIQEKVDTVMDAGNGVITDLQESVDKFSEMVDNLNPMKLFR